jgi:hypothetical protein
MWYAKIAKKQLVHTLVIHSFSQSIFRIIVDLTRCLAQSFVVGNCLCAPFQLIVKIAHTVFKSLAGEKRAQAFVFFAYSPRQIGLHPPQLECYNTHQNDS